MRPGGRWGGRALVARAWAVASARGGSSLWQKQQQQASELVGLQQEQQQWRGEATATTGSRGHPCPIFYENPSSNGVIFSRESNGKYSIFQSFFMVNMQLRFFL